jgi:hypothetical protein
MISCSVGIPTQIFYQGGSRGIQKGITYLHHAWQAGSEPGSGAGRGVGVMNRWWPAGQPLVVRWYSAAIPLVVRWWSSKIGSFLRGVTWCSVGIPLGGRWCSKKFVSKNVANYLSFGEVRLSRPASASFLNIQHQPNHSYRHPHFSLQSPHHVCRVIPSRNGDKTL